jgi:hypothetical protein
MWDYILRGFETLNELLTAGIAITAFSLLIYALSFNLRDRVARSFAIILICVVAVFVADAIGSSTNVPFEMDFWLRFQWVGIIFLPSAYLHFSDALLSVTGKPSRGRRRMLVIASYAVSLFFLVMLVFDSLVGPLVQNAIPAPHLQRTFMTLVFTLGYIAAMVLSWVNFWRAYQRTLTTTSRRRFKYLILGALSPALGSYPYLLFGSTIASEHPLIFWIAATVSNLAVYVLLILMAYSVAFFGVPWPDRVVKRRLVKWLMRGPVTAAIVLALTTIVRRSGTVLGSTVSTLVPVIMVGGILLLEHIITLVAPIWERWLFFGGDRAHMYLLNTLEERLLTPADLRQFLESVLAAVVDRLQTGRAFIVTFNSTRTLDMVVSVSKEGYPAEDLSNEILELVKKNGFESGLFMWGNYWLAPLYASEDDHLLGILGVSRLPDQTLDEFQQDSLSLLVNRATLALEDIYLQQQAVNSLVSITPQVEMIQRLRAASRYDGTGLLAPASEESFDSDTFSRWVKDALTHYWGGPKLTQSPLLKLEIVRQSLAEHEGSPANALRAILNQAIQQTRPEGERRFTADWILFNILEMKFMEGRKVREIASRLAMSEADLYRKQRVAIEAVAATLVDMEEKAREENAYTESA